MSRAEKWEQLMRESILDGVLGALTEQGSEGLTMKRVAEKAGVAKGTLYSYFDNKTELLEAAVQSSLEPLQEQLGAILDSDDDPETKLRKVVDRHLTYFDEHREIFRVLLYERHKVIGKWGRYKTSRYRRFVDGIAGIIAQGVEQGQFRGVDPVKTATMLAEANISLIHQRLFGDKCSPLTEDRDLVVDIFLNGIREQ